MLTQNRFGAHQGPTCPACTRSMYVTRRMPHPLYGNTYELQTFKCGTCGNEIERSADQSGLAHVNDAALNDASDRGLLFKLARDRAAK
jgi:hypothetical protein